MTDHDYTLDAIQNAETKHKARAAALGAIGAVTQSPSAYDIAMQKIKDLINEKDQRIKELDQQ